MSKIEEITKIVNFLKKYKIENATINKVNDDFIVDVDGSVDIYRDQLTEISIQFGRVSGYFDCSINNLTSLKGCPKYVGGTFYCENNQLTSLEGCPKYVGGDFDCNDNELESLDGSPKEVMKSFYCEHNPQLKSLKGIGKVLGFIYSDFYEGKLENYKGK